MPHRPPLLPDLARTVLDLMRTANEPMTAHEMALRLLQEHGLDHADLPQAGGSHRRLHEPGRRAAGGACQPAQAAGAMAIG